MDTGPPSPQTNSPAASSARHTPVEDTRTGLARLEVMAARQQVDRAEARLDRALDAQLAASVHTIVRLHPDLARPVETRQ